MESACRIYRPRYPRKTARAAELAAFLVDEVVEDVGHAQWVFTIPKMLRVYFLHHRELLGELSRAAAETARELLAAAAGEEEGFRPGVVSMVRTFGDRANFHPHVHALVTRGGWHATGEWIPVAYVDERAAEELFRHKVLALLRRRGLLSQERIELLLSWRRSGFSVHNRVFAHPGDGRDFEALVRYMMRSPVSLTRLRFTPGAKAGRLHPQGRTRRAGARGRREDRRGRVCRPGPGADPGPQTARRALLRGVLEPGEGSAPKGRGAARGARLE